MICDSLLGGGAAWERDECFHPRNRCFVRVMPNTKSAKKRMRQTDVRRTRNRAVKSAVKTQLKKVREAATAGNLEVAETEYRVAARKLDKAAAAKVIHKNSASRHKARLVHLIKTAKAAKK